MGKDKKHPVEELDIPCSTEIELTLLSELIQTPENIETATAIINQSMFSDERLAEVWRIITQMDTDRELIDFTTISGRIPKDTLLELISPKYGVGIGSVFTIREHCAALRNAAIRRKMFLSAWRMVQESTNNAVDINELLAMPGALSESIVNDIVTNNSVMGISDVMTRLATSIEQAQINSSQGKRSRIPTGFSFLDALTFSGFNPGNLVILAARPSVGKTAIMLQMATAASRAGFAADIYSLEMTNEELAQRMVLSTGFVTQGQIAAGSVDWESFEKANGIISKMPLYLNDSARTLEDITTDIVANHRRGRCDIAFIDYLGLIQGNNPRQPLYQAIGERTARLKHLAKECRIPIVLLCQLNRVLEGENRPPELYDLRDSGSIEQDADIVLMLERASHDLADKDVNLWVRKNRQGKAGNVMIPLTANDSFTAFSPRLEDRNIMDG